MAREDVETHLKSTRQCSTRAVTVGRRGQHALQNKTYGTHEDERACITHLRKHHRQFRCDVSRARVATLKSKSGALGQRESKRKIKKGQRKGAWG
jgi:hypothetical protein